MRLRQLLIALVALLSFSVQAEGWHTVGGGREVHYRIFLPDNAAMLDIACSVNLRVLLGATFITNRSGQTRNFYLYIDGVSVPNYLNPETPAKYRSNYYRFWNELQNAHKLEVYSDGMRYNIDTTNLKEQLPSTYDPRFVCRPVTVDGLLVP